MSHRFVRRVRVVGAIAALGLALTACGADKIAERAAEEAIEQGGNGDVDVDLDGEDGIKVESSDGSFEMGSNSVPEGFPTDTVPLIEGQVINGARMTEGEDTTWSVSLQVDQPPSNAYTEAKAQLESAGFESVQTSESAGYSHATMEGNDLTVLVTTVESNEGGAMVSYQVHPGQP